MEEIWKTLPNDLTRHILGFCDIDTRRVFEIPPRRLPKSTIKFRKGKLFIYNRNQHRYTIGIKLSYSVFYMIHIQKTPNQYLSQNRNIWYFNFNKDLDKTNFYRKYVYED
jgi:hypothetical protein